MVTLFSYPQQRLENAIGINIKSNFHLRNTTGDRRYACEFKLARQVVILGHGSLTYINLNEYTRLVVRVAGESLRLICRNGGIVLEDSHDSTSSFNSKVKRSDIQQQQVLNIFRFVSRQNGYLDSCTLCKSLTRVDALI